MSPWLIGTGVFVAMTVLDFVYAEYTRVVNEQRAVLSGVLAMLICGIGGSITIGYVADPIYLIPALAGAFVGTWASVRRASTGPAHQPSSLPECQNRQ